MAGALLLAARSSSSGTRRARTRLPRVHILAVIVWVGGDITLTTLGIVFESKQDGPTLAALGRMGSWIGTRVYTPALFFVSASGSRSIEKSGTLGPLLDHLRLVGWALAMMIGISFVGPELGRIDGRLRSSGPSRRGGATRQAVFTIFRFDTALLVLGRPRHGGEAKNF